MMTMVKGAAISMRVEPSLKARLEAAASDAGMTLAAFAERALELHSKGPVWSLIYPEVFHSERVGTAIKLQVAEGWPVALLKTEHAEQLGQQLLKAVAVTKRIEASPDLMRSQTEDHEEADEHWPVKRS
jgi:hypothetical protein